MLNDSQQKWSPRVITLFPHLTHFLLPGWFRIGHSQVITWNNRCPGAPPPPLRTVSLGSEHMLIVSSAWRYVQVQRVWEHLLWGQGVPTWVRKKQHRIKSVFNTLRFLYDPLLLQRNVWAFIIKMSSFSIASYASKKKIFSVCGKGLMEVLNI